MLFAGKGRRVKDRKEMEKATEEGRSEVRRLEKEGIFLWGSIWMNGLMAAGKLLLSLMTHSFFMRVHALYNIGMGAARYLVLRGRKEEEKQQQARCRQVGALILLSSVVYMLYAARLFFSGTTGKYPPVAGIAIAAFTFAELTANCVGLVRANRKGDWMKQVEKLTSLASSLICLVLTQTAILSFADASVPAEANGMAGLLFGGAAAAIGAYLILRRTDEGNETAEESSSEKEKAVPAEQ